MKIAVPIENGKLSPHFGRAKEFAIIEVDDKNKKVISMKTKTPPPHDVGVLPSFLRENGVKLLLAGGIGRRAVSFFNNFGIKIVSGLKVDTPLNLVNAYFNNSLQKDDEEICDH